MSSERYPGEQADRLGMSTSEGEAEPREPGTDHGMSDERWDWAAASAASGGTVAGVPVGGGFGILLARALGFRESVADYGPAFFITVTAACLLGLAGCYLALRLLRDSRALPTVIILAVLLPGAALSVEPMAHALAARFDWTFGVLIPVGVVLYVCCPVLAAVVARLIAGLLPAGNSHPAPRGSGVTNIGEIKRY